VRAIDVRRHGDERFEHVEIDVRSGIRARRAGHELRCDVKDIENP